MTHNTESTAVRNLKPEWWESLLVQEKHRGEKACDKRRSAAAHDTACTRTRLLIHFR
jgi:hypothetical protein